MCWLREDAQPLNLKLVKDCVCLHIAVVMQALMKLAEDVSLCVSDQRSHGYSVSLFTQTNKTVFLGNA